MEGSIAGYCRIVSQFTRAGLRLECFSMRSNQSHIRFSLAFHEEKQFSISVPNRPLTRKQRNRMVSFLLFLNGKGYRRALARRLTACGCGIVKPQNIYVVKPEWA